MELEGWVVAAVAVLLLCYALPPVVSRRQLGADSRVEDRFSPGLRVLAVVGESSDDGRRPGATPAHRALPGRTSPPPLLPRRPEATAVTTFSQRHSTPAKQARDLAHARAQRAARVSRRSAAMRRRTVLLAVIMLLAILGWLLVAFTSASLTVGIVPSVVLLALTALAIGADRTARRKDRIDRAEMKKLDAQLRELARSPRARREVEDVVGGEGRVGGSSRGSNRGRVGCGEERGSGPLLVADEGLAGGADEAAVSEVRPDARADATLRGDHSAAAPQAADGAKGEQAGWTPVPLPAPRWSDTGAAPRRDVPAYEPEVAPSAPVPVRPSRANGSSRSVVAGSGTEHGDAPADGSEPGKVLDMDAVLARRRASGQ